MGYVDVEKCVPTIVSYIHVTLSPSVVPLIVVMASILPDYTNYISDEL